MLKNAKKIVATALVFSAVFATTVNASTFSQVGIGRISTGRCAFTGSHDSVYVTAKVAYNKSTSPEASSGNQDGTTPTDLWAQTKYITGIGGTASGYHTAWSADGKIITTYTSD